MRISALGMNFTFSWSLAKRSVRFWWQRRTRGWDDSETWGLDSTIAKWTLPRLRRFRELNFGHPGDMTMEEWNSTIDDMIYGLEVCEKESDSVVVDCDWDRVQRGLEAFGRHFRNLWW